MITLYTQNKRSTLARKVRVIIDKEFGQLLPFETKWVERQFPLMPTVEKTRGKEEIVVDVGDRRIVVSEGYTGSVNVVLVGSRGWGQPGPRGKHYYGVREDRLEPILIDLVYTAARLQ